MWDNIIREAQTQELLLGDDYLLDKVSHLIIGLNWYASQALQPSLEYTRKGECSWNIPVTSYVYELSHN
jgi:hypothetical protein